MNILDFLKGKKTYATIVMGLLYVLGVYIGWWEFDEKVAAAFGLGAIAFLRSSLKSPPAPLLLAGLLCLGVGCAVLQPGADAFVVRAEQSQGVARATFDLVLNLDHQDRGFWRQKAPAFHEFCEWLRTPATYAGSNAPRVIVMEYQVDDLKLAYQASRSSANSNALYGALALLRGLTLQAQSWANIVTNRIYPDL